MGIVLSLAITTGREAHLPETTYSKADISMKMASNKLMENNSGNFAEDAAAFFSVLAQFVKMKEGHPHNHNYEWTVKDIIYIQAALDEMTEVQRSAFREHFRDYQIVKILAIPRQGSS